MLNLINFKIILLQKSLELNGRISLFWWNDCMKRLFDFLHETTFFDGSFKFKNIVTTSYKIFKLLSMNQFRNNLSRQRFFCWKNRKKNDQSPYITDKTNENEDQWTMKEISSVIIRVVKTPGVRTPLDTNDRSPLVSDTSGDRTPLHFWCPLVSRFS